MKYACDICERIAGSYSSKDWLRIKAKNYEYMLCQTCEERFWQMMCGAKVQKEKKDDRD